VSLCDLLGKYSHEISCYLLAISQTLVLRRLKDTGFSITIMAQKSNSHYDQTQTKEIQCHRLAIPETSRFSSDADTSFAAASCATHKGHFPAAVRDIVGTVVQLFSSTLYGCYVLSDFLLTVYRTSFPSADL
jgi:hypothetical protein